MPLSPANSEGFHLFSSKTPFFKILHIYIYICFLSLFFLFMLLFLILFFLCVFFFFFFFSSLFFLHIIFFTCSLPIPFDTIIIFRSWPIFLSSFSVVFLMFVLFASGFTCCCCFENEVCVFVVDVCFCFCFEGLRVR